MLRIALDGPAGSGKSSVAKVISKKLNITYLDTGAMYRCVTLHLMNSKIDFEDKNAIALAIENIKIDFNGNQVYLNDVDVTDDIRSPEVNENVPKLASLNVVRQKMASQQIRIGESQSVIMDGRDIGTVIMPNAEFKFFLTASVEERAQRRLIELKEKGFQVELNELILDMTQRDKLDSEREHSPLRQADDAILIDTTQLTFDEVVDKITNICKGE